MKKFLKNFSQKRAKRKRNYHKKITKGLLKFSKKTKKSFNPLIMVLKKETSNQMEKDLKSRKNHHQQQLLLQIRKINLSLGKGGMFQV